MTTEATTDLGSNAFQITDAAKRQIDPKVAISVFDDGSPLPSPGTNLVSVDYLKGIVNLAGAYTPSGAITITGNYLPQVRITHANEFSLSIAGEEKDISSFGFANRLKIKSILDATGSFNMTGPLDYLDQAIDGDAVMLKITDESNGRFISIYALLMESAATATVSDPWSTSYTYTYGIMPDNAVGTIAFHAGS